MAKDQSEKVYWTLLNHEGWQLYLAATEKGLAYVGSIDAPFEELSAWVSKRIPNYALEENRSLMKPYEMEIVEFLEGLRRDFTIPLDLRGSEFQHRVWAELLRVPFGKSATYTEIAEKIQRPDAVRAVGTAIGANPLLIIAPCHRILGKHGECRGYRGGLEMRRRLLELEK